MLKKIYLLFCVLSLINGQLTAQENNVPTLHFSKPNLNQLMIENQKRDELGLMYRFATGIETNITPENSGIWTTDSKGNKIWRLHIKYPGAQALSFLFSSFHIYGLTTFNVYNKEGLRLHTTVTSKDVLEHGQQNIELCSGDDMMLELIEPKGTRPSSFVLNELFYAYRGLTSSLVKNFKDSESCEVNVNCTEGANWQDEKKGVARILVKAGTSFGWCSGSLVNNVKKDCKPYFLTATHCASGTTTNDYNQWKFYFNYESSTCTTPNNENSIPNNAITGCFKIAGSDDVNGDNISKSDFLLVQLGTSANVNTTITTLKNWGVYWNGWDANNIAPASGVGIHHPAGDIKKISTYTQTATSSSYSGTTPNTHWQVKWSATTNGHGVTEGGSSGSPLFNYNGGNSRIVGTLSGGTSLCNALTSPDVYGKVSYHWTSVATTSTKQLKPWLDPDNTGVLTLDGSYNPCNSTNPPSSGPCAASSSSCDEYIANVKLNTIDNTTNCANYTDYSSISTNLTAGNQYTAYVTTGVIGQGTNMAYTNDKIGVWIDFNGDNDFDDPNELIGIKTFDANYNGAFTFTVPNNVTHNALVRMRVRIAYNTTLTACGTTADGEVEDYRIKLIKTLGLNDLENNQFSLFPNPATSELTIQLDEHFKDNQLTICDMNGRILQSIRKENSTTITIDISRLESGVYQCVLQNSLGKVVKKFIKI